MFKCVYLGVFDTYQTSLLAGKHVKRTRYAYQLTLAWLHVLKVQAYDHYCRNGLGPHEPMEMWEKRLISNVPTINYWTSVREYLLINCRFVRVQRLGDWLHTLNGLSMVFRFWTHTVCPLGASLLE